VGSDSNIIDDLKSPQPAKLAGQLLLLEKSRDMPVISRRILGRHVIRATDWVPIGGAPPFIEVAPDLSLGLLIKAFASKVRVQRCAL
jgi:hypothetical protein